MINNAIFCYLIIITVQRIKSSEERKYNSVKKNVITNISLGDNFHH